MKALMDNLKEQVINLGHGTKTILRGKKGENPISRVILSLSDVKERIKGLQTIFNQIKEQGQTIMLQLRNVIGGARFLVVDQKGQTALDQVIAILISLVLGALLLAGLYALFGDVVLPLLKERILNMFDYAG